MQFLIQAVSELPTARMWDSMTEKCHFTNSLYTSKVSIIALATDKAVSKTDHLKQIGSF